MQTKLLINGKLVAGAGKVEAVLNPATGKVLAKVPEASRGQVNAAVAAADAAFDGWSRTPPKDRATLLLKLADRIEADGEAYAKLESLNCGKPYAAALGDEIPAIADVFRFFAGACRSMTGAVAGEYLAGFTSMIRRDPVGVVASIAPWNYPLMMAAWKLGPALAAGNTCVLKPSEQTPLTALRLAELLAEIFPAGVVNVVCGRGPSVGAPLTRHPRVRMISLTGDVATGARILGQSAEGIKRTHLELGGKAPVIVFDDADVEAVVSGVRTFGYYNAGQDCTAACRLYAGARVYDRLVADLSSAVSTIKTGAQTAAGVEMGPLISAEQRKRVAGFVSRARRQKHIEVTTGGRAGTGGRDRAPRGLRPGGVGHALQGHGAGDRLGQRFRLRPRILGVDAGHRQGAGRGLAAPVRVHVDQHALHAGERDAARWSQAFRLWQGSLDVRARGLHRGPPRDGETVVTGRPCTPTTSRDGAGGVGRPTRRASGRAC
jgi:aminobutyraldehyde dehydrogenase